MFEKFVFTGTTTFINKPKNIIIENFQNNYLSGDDSIKDKVNKEILNLVENVYNSKSLSLKQKEKTITTLHSLAKQVKEGKTNKSSFKSVLQKIQKVLSKAADITVPALSIITSILKLLGIN